MKLLYTDIIKIDYDSLRVQQVKNHENFINRFTGRNEKAKMVMPNVTDDGKRKVDNMLRDIELSGRKKIALCIRSGCLTKDWPLEYFKMTVELLTQKYAAMFYVIGSQADLPFADDFIKMTNADVINFCGQTTLPELGYLLQRSDFFLSVDTGSAHICGAVGTPMVVVFGSTSPQRWGPYTDNAVYISPQIECYPCDGTKRKCVEPACLATIKPDEVYAGVIDLCKPIFMKNGGTAHYDIQQNEY